MHSPPAKGGTWDLQGLSSCGCGVGGLSCGLVPVFDLHSRSQVLVHVIRRKQGHLGMAKAQDVWLCEDTSRTGGCRCSWCQPDRVRAGLCKGPGRVWAHLLSAFGGFPLGMLFSEVRAWAAECPLGADPAMWSRHTEGQGWKDKVQPCFLARESVLDRDLKGMLTQL